MNLPSMDQPDSDTPVAREMVAIVVPYYQMEGGILGRALRSVLAQVMPEGVGWHVVLVDDASPRPAHDELDALPDEITRSVTVIEQANAGPGGARNTALDWIVAQTRDPAGRFRFDTVAFLDSDDTWSPRHLSDALACLRRGFDMYCSNHCRFEDTLSYFDQVPAAVQMFRPGAQGVQLLDADGPVLDVSPPALLTAQLRSYISQTSTVVIRLERVAERRFDVEQRRAGEDHLYWVGLAADGCRTAVSWRSNVHCGRGVNVYFSALDWDAPMVLERVGHVLLFHLKVAQLFHLTPDDSAVLQDRIRHYENGYGYLFTRALLKRQRPSFALLARLSRASPRLMLRLPGRFLHMLTDRRAEARFW
jgi:succinoglycan biosynthesis protein ExoW